MVSTSANMSLQIPALNGDPGVFDTYLNASLALIDLHDHGPGKGVTVKSNGIGINADLTFAGYAATNLGAAAFTAQAAYTTNNALWVSSANNDLYFRRAGTDNRLTVGGVLNISLVGGIAGDYAAAAASLYYDDAAEAYRFLEAAPSPNSWSRVLCGDLDLYEHISGATNRVRLSSPAALAASYALTFPAAAAGSTLLWQVTSAGAITFSNTIENDVALGTDKHVTISGTGRYKHGSLVKTVGPFNAYINSGTWTYDLGGLRSTSLASLILGVEFQEGERVTSYTVALYGNGSADLDITVAHHTAAGTYTVIGSATVTNQAAAWSDTTINVTDTTIGAGDIIYVVLSASATGLLIGANRFTYDRP